MIFMIVLVIIVWYVASATGSFPITIFNSAYSRAVWLRRDYPDWINVPNLIISCVSVAVAFIPEGLPVALTASMTISAKMMRKNKILCKSLKTVETLGSVSVICSDKTGTLTQVYSLQSIGRQTTPPDIFH
jgi:magnesium-transporting ATPase (P-type)